MDPGGPRTRGPSRRSAPHIPHSAPRSTSATTTVNKDKQQRTQIPGLMLGQEAPAARRESRANTNAGARPTSTSGPAPRHKRASRACSLRASARIEAVVGAGRRCWSQGRDERRRPPNRALLLSPNLSSATSIPGVIAFDGTRGSRDQGPGAAIRAKRSCRGPQRPCARLVGQFAGRRVGGRLIGGSVSTRSERAFTSRGSTNAEIIGVHHRPAPVIPRQRPSAHP